MVSSSLSNLLETCICWCSCAPPLSSEHQFGIRVDAIINIGPYPALLPVLMILESRDLTVYPQHCFDYPVPDPFKVEVSVCQNPLINSI